MLVTLLHNVAHPERGLRQTFYSYETDDNPNDIAVRLTYMAMKLNLTSVISFGRVNFMGNKVDAIVLHSQELDDDLFIWSQILRAATGSPAGVSVVKKSERD